ncbi:unnamed protein product [Callosobruchus maculatus]|uniref:Odorant receptor n=1 Tax=Callosobruchus maculatus TaxID=64391 RepID=A0A653CRI5_CALMS|nr:unnamed protein product [Callosobruchus maculatus]
MILVTCTTFQFKLLNDELKSLFDEDLSTREAINKFHERYTKTINDRYSLHLAVLFFTLTTFEAALRSILFVVAGVAQIFMMCYTIPAQRLTDEANKAGESIYFSLWYNYPKYAKPLINLIARSHKKVKIVPCGIMELSLEQGLAVIKNMVSYAMFLKTMESMADNNIDSYLVFCGVAICPVGFFNRK